MEGYAKDARFEILHNIGTDGISFILADKVNAATDEAFDKWMEYIYKHCEEPSIVGYSMHGLLIGRKWPYWIEQRIIKSKSYLEGGMTWVFIIFSAGSTGKKDLRQK